jgi:hypothetical protein
VAHASDLVESLLAADPAARDALLRETEPGRLDAAIEALGRRHETAAAEVLSRIDSVVDDRGLRKAARRELHRLRSVGIHAPESSTPEAPAARAESVTPIGQAWATDIDAGGSRGLWLLGERPLGGAWMAAMLLNDLSGLRELSLIDTTRKRFLAELDERRRDQASWVQLPGDYALRLIKEAVDLTRERGGGLPTRYHAFRDVFGEAPAGPERALVYETISPVEVNFNPGWLEETPLLLREPELAGWHLPVPESFAPRALEVARAPSASLLVPGHPPEQQALQLLADAGREVLTPPLRRALRRRLEETAQVFLDSARLPAARRAVAAARALEEPGLSPERHPLLRMLLAASLARAIQTETVGSRRASDALLELLERAAESPRDASPRPSGLILPR